MPRVRILGQPGRAIRCATRAADATHPDGVRPGPGKNALKAALRSRCQAKRFPAPRISVPRCHSRRPHPAGGTGAHHTEGDGSSLRGRCPGRDPGRARLPRRARLRHRRRRAGPGRRRNAGRPADGGRPGLRGQGAGGPAAPGLGARGGDHPAGLRAPSSETPSPEPSGTTSAPAPSPNGGGGDLAKTGGSSATGPIAIGAVVLVAGGAAFVVASKRRRTARS
ncbi:LAETG motif-containing sortase-dependent surface protein [Streptomyces sp. NPDC093982]|uniref:LAETG motif-containing sortase-dependent surface protein n=1 Tax=Streptomyces sp. NPDC093982 TaxID=3155077 RepID=UPI00342FF777